MIAPCDGGGVSGGSGGAGYPGSFEEDVAQDGHLVASVFRGGRHIAEDCVSVSGAVFAGQPAGDLLLDFRGSQVAFGLVRGGRYPQVGGEAQHVGPPLVQGFQ